MSARKLELEMEREWEVRAFQLMKLELEIAAKKAEAPRVDVPLALTQSVLLKSLYK